VRGPVLLVQAFGELPQHRRIAVDRADVEAVRLVSGGRR
jgi:hypothetical protein